MKSKEAPDSSEGKEAVTKEGSIDGSKKSQPTADAVSCKKTSSGTNLDDWSFEQLAKTRSDTMPYSEGTLKQVETIKQLVEEQEKETQQKIQQSDAKEDDCSGRRSSFVQDMDEIKRVIDKAHQKMAEKQE